MSCRNPGREHTSSAEHLKQGYEMTVEALPFSPSSEILCFRSTSFCLSTLTDTPDHMVENRPPVGLKFHLFPFQPGRGRIHLHSHSHLQNLQEDMSFDPTCQIPNPSRRGRVMRDSPNILSWKFLSDLENLEKMAPLHQRKVILKDRDAEQAKPWVPISWVVLMVPGHWDVQWWNVRCTQRLTRAVLQSMSQASNPNPATYNPMSHFLVLSVAQVFLQNEDLKRSTVFSTQ